MNRPPSLQGFAVAAGLMLRIRCRVLRATSLLLAVAVAACATPQREPAVPPILIDQATVLGIPNSRFWADTQALEMVAEAQQALARERATPGNQAVDDASLGQASLLALSGGGDDGAFGAGLLLGWTEAGTRPSFKLVTGVSTGALIAPFAFLGPAYDAQIRAVYTDVTPDDVYTERWLPTAVFTDALSDSAPLFRLISRYANEDMRAAIAREYGKGRLLLIGTTNLDEQRPIIWNIGAIAASGRPGALDLIRKVLLASASIPGVFPPILIDVEVGGQRYQEMHVDGGAVAQAFLVPAQVGALVDMKCAGLARERHAFVIRNGRLDPDWASVDRRLFSITGRAIATMIHYSGYNDIMRIYFSSQRDGIDFNLAYIGRDFTVVHEKDFDQPYMRALFDYGFQKGRKGYPWLKQPPQFVQAEADPGSGAAAGSATAPGSR